MAKLRLVVADDNPPFLRKLVSLLANEFDVVATATDGQTALDLIRRYEPDVTVLDLKMPALSGLQVARELARHPFSPPVVICSTETDPEIVEAARQLGVAEYVFKSRFETDLILAVKSAIPDDSAASLATQERLSS